MTESFLDGRVTLHPGDCLDVLAQLEECSIDSCVTDPPYHLTSIVKRFGGNGAAPAQFGTDGAYARASAGFMGKQWDGGDIAFRVETWAAVYRVLKPGAHLLAFGGTRTSHRMVCAIEDAGFEIRDIVMWLYGSGFPKSHDVSKGIDKTRDDSSEIEHVRRWLELERQRAGITRKAVNAALGLADNGGGLMSSWTTNKTTACIPQWEQWLQLKSLLGFGNEIDAEVWRLNGRKGTPGEAWNDRKFYDEPTGGLHGGSGNTVGAWKLGRQAKPGGATDAARKWEGWGTALKPACEPIVLARKPLSESTVAANVLRWGTGAINVDGCRVSTDEAITPFGSPKRSVGGIMNGTEAAREQFQQSNFGRWPANVIHDGSEEVVGAFPETQITGRPNCVGKSYSTEGREVFGTDGERQFGGSYLDSGSAARFFYTAKADSDDRLGSKHPTVKPLDLMQYLVRLVTPPKLIELVCESCNAGSHEKTLSRQVGGLSKTVPAVHGGVLEPTPDGQVLLTEMSCREHGESADTMPDMPQDDSQSGPNILFSGMPIGEPKEDANIVSEGLRGVRGDVQTEGRSDQILQPRLFSESERACKAEASFKDDPRLSSSVSAGPSDGGKDGLCDGSPSFNGGTSRPEFELSGSGSSHQRYQGRQSDREFASDAQGASRQSSEAEKTDDNQMSALRETNEVEQRCPKCNSPLTRAEKYSTVLDPFAGTGTTGEAAWREGMRSVLIERETEYQADIRRRMALVLAGPDERVRESVKARGKPVDYGPLFGVPA